LPSSLRLNLQRRERYTVAMQYMQGPFRSTSYGIWQGSLAHLFKMLVSLPELYKRSLHADICQPRTGSSMALGASPACISVFSQQPAKCDSSLEPSIAGH
jgi:hypothetical protein